MNTTIAFWFSSADFSLARELGSGYNPCTMQEKEVAYQEALDYLYRFIDYSLKRNFRYAPEKFNLERMFVLLEALGNPHKQYPVIHVAGTKGKGSVSAMIDSGLQAAGHRVGLYTSPHLQDFAERIQVNRQNIPHEDVARGVENLKPLVAKIPDLTTFELMTALSFWYFAQQQVDVAVIEVGLGGRLDATNVVDPLVSVITSISMDHTAILGNTIHAIAGEKAGIIKSNRPVVMSRQPADARTRIMEIAAQREARLVDVAADYVYAPEAHSLDGQTVLIWPKDELRDAEEFIVTGGQREWTPNRLHISLLGPHQVDNAATAYAALQTARLSGLDVPEEAIREGLATCHWPGRFEVLQRLPPVIVDGAHNRASAHCLRLTVDEYFPNASMILVFGASSDKDILGMFESLLPRAQAVIFTQSVHPRAMDVEELAVLAAPFDIPVTCIPVVSQALEAACQHAVGNAAVVVAGSLFVAASARIAWKENVHQSQGRSK